MKKILLTGLSGYIAGNLAQYLTKLEYEVSNIATIDFMAEVWSELDEFKPDVVVHCGWPTKIDLQATDHLEMAEKSCNFFNECKKRGIRVINIGSSSEYGVKDEPMREDMICEPITTYGIAKLSVTLFAKKLGFNTLRLFTIHGGDGGHSFYDIKEDVVKWPWPNTVRDFYPISLLNKQIEQLIHAGHIYGEIINIGVGRQLKYNELRPFDNSGDPDHEDNYRWNSYAQKQYEPGVWISDPAKMNRLLNI